MKEQFCTGTTKGGYNYYYGSSNNYLVLLHEIQKHIIDHYVSSDSIDIDGCYADTYINTQNRFLVEHYIAEIDLFLEKGFFSCQNQSDIDPLQLKTTPIRNSFASANNLVFEVTEKCNLTCKYCIYGDCYNHYAPRDSYDMSFDTAKAMIDYKVNLWLSNYNNSAKITKVIGFYGGEPLLNVALIKQIVSYVKELGDKFDIKFKFNITTNGTLLDKHLDYLVGNDFLITISLDGNACHNQYRVFGNNQPSFDKVFENTVLCKEKYNDFFRKNVRFNSVLNNKSNVDEISNFFLKTFDKQVEFSPLSLNGDNKEVKNMLYKDSHIFDSFSTDYPFRLKNDRTNLFTSDIYLCHYSLLSTLAQKKLFRTGTCVPFSKKVFVTAKGIVIMCERIAHEYAMGEVKDSHVSIDFDKAAELFNLILKKRLETCILCCSSSVCSECIFQLENNSCDKFTSEQDYKSQIISQIQHYERNASPTCEDEYWLYLHQFVYFINRGSSVLIYNELNHSLLEYKDIVNPVLLKIIERFNSISDETYAIELKKSELDNEGVKAFIEDIKNHFSGNLIKKENQTKPFIRKPSIHIINNAEFLDIDDEYLISYRLKLSVSEITINTGTNSESNNLHVFKELKTKPPRYDVYDYLNTITTQIKEFKQLKQVNIICYQDTLLDQIKAFAQSVKQDARVCMHLEIENAEKIINYLEEEFIYYIYFDPTENNFELLKKLSLKENSCTMVPFAQVESNEDIEKFETLSSTYSVEYNIYPIITENSTILDQLIKSKEDILGQNLTVKDINKNGIINKNTFGRIYIHEQGEISTLGLNKSPFNIMNHSIMDFAFDQIKTHKDWFLLRSSVHKCKDCVFQNMCPPISSHEVFLGKYDLCNIR